MLLVSHYDVDTYFRTLMSYGYIDSLDLHKRCYEQVVYQLNKCQTTVALHFEISLVKIFSWADPAIHSE